MANVMFDTNVYIFHSLQYSDAIYVWEKYAVNQNYDVILSTIQISELLSYPKLDDQPLLKLQRERYISLADQVIPVDDEIAREAAEIRRMWNRATGKTLKLPDALIAATAIVNKALLVSNNDRDFIYLSKHYGLQYENPIQNQEHLVNYIEQIKLRTE